MFTNFDSELEANGHDYSSIILGTALGLLIGFCALVYVLMVVIS